MGRPTKQFYEFGPFRLDPVERLLYRDGEVAPLTAKIFDILLVFVRNSGRTLEKEEMMREVWPDQLVEEGNLTRNVSTLRKALGESPDGARYIVTIPGRGGVIRRQWTSGRSLAPVRPEIPSRDRNISELARKKTEKLSAQRQTQSPLLTSRSLTRKVEPSGETRTIAWQRSGDATGQ